VVEAGGAVTVNVLGPFEVIVGGRPVALTTGRLRALLAVLAMSAGHSVSLDRLAAAVWGANLPADPRRGIQLYVTRLRGALGAAAIATEPAGYALRTEPDNVDALRFLRLREAAAADPATERVRLIEALGLWRGTPFDGIPGGWLTDTQRPRLVEHYLAAVERRVDLDLAQGHHQELVGELTDLTAQHPLRESLAVRLLLALDRCGRAAEALERYESIRVRLADELGADPGPELRQIHVELLAGGHATTGVTGPVEAGRRLIPQQLPPDIDSFTGRNAALKALANLLDCVPDRGNGPVVISAIAGTAGVGKTTLAVHWAHQIADRFPDGQLYVNLRGFGAAREPNENRGTSTGQALEPAKALHGFLDALGVPPHRIPPDLTAQTGLYRSLLADKRVLVVLDNARDADQIRPLLPGSPGCLVVVTSRNQLTSLVATEAAHPIMLDLMPIEEARELLARRLGEDRIAAEPAAVDTIISSCAQLPLALVIAAARAAVQPGFPLRALATDLQRAPSSLDAFDAGDPATDVRAVFSWSYRTLSSDAARLFRLMGVHPGPEITVPVAASVAGQPVAAVRPLLAELARANLLTEHSPGRYHLHDLLRTYAAELVGRDTGTGRQAAQHRLLDHYLHTARAAAALLNPQRGRPELGQPGQGVTLEHLADYHQALAWFTTERQALLNTVGQASEGGNDAYVCELARALAGYLERKGRWREWADTQTARLAAAQRLRDRALIAEAHRSLGRALVRLGQAPAAHDHYRQALDLFVRLDDGLGQLRTHVNISLLFEQQRRYHEMLQHALLAMELLRDVDDRAAQANVLNQVGWSYALVEDYEQAVTHCRRAISLHREVGDRDGEAATWDSLGYAYHHLRRYPEAVGCLQRALDLFRDLGDPYEEAGTLTRLGDTHEAANQLGTAQTYWKQALAILDDLDHPTADQVRAKLADLGMGSATAAAGGG
jgi:DNA-binding SARP family transcriptional activator